MIVGADVLLLDPSPNGHGSLEPELHVPTPRNNMVGCDAGQAGLGPGRIVPFACQGVFATKRTVSRVDSTVMLMPTGSPVL